MRSVSGGYGKKPLHQREDQVILATWKDGFITSWLEVYMVKLLGPGAQHASWLPALAAGSGRRHDPQHPRLEGASVLVQPPVQLPRLLPPLLLAHALLLDHAGCGKGMGPRFGRARREWAVRAACLHGEAGWRCVSTDRATPSHSAKCRTSRHECRRNRQAGAQNYPIRMRVHHGCQPLVTQRIRVSSWPSTTMAAATGTHQAIHRHKCMTRSAAAAP